MSSISIILAEDEPALGQIIKESLETRDFSVVWKQDGEAALRAFQEEAPDILVLDVMMPKIDGFQVAEKIREIDDSTPIIFLTAKSQTKDVVQGFSIGGNDYLKKPFSMEELIVRIHNLIKRSALQKTADILEIGHYTFNFPKQKLSYKDEPAVMLTHREAHLLFNLIKQKNQLLDRSFILNKLWGTDDFFSSRSMDVFISKLRKKLNKDQSIQIINVRGYGYKLIV